MAGMMTWFQVTCPKCTGALQVRLPEGVTSVQCSQCKAVFAVQVQPVALNSSSGSAPAAKRSRKRKKDSTGASPSAAGGSGQPQPPRALSAYNVFMKGEVAKVKSEHPELAHREAFKLAAERWQSSPMNPQNGGDRFPLKLDDGTAAGTAAVGGEEGAGEDGAADEGIGDEGGGADEAGAGEEDAGGMGEDALGMDDSADAGADGAAIDANDATVAEGEQMTA